MKSQSREKSRITVKLTVNVFMIHVCTNYQNCNTFYSKILEEFVKNVKVDLMARCFNSGAY